MHFRFRLGVVSLVAIALIAGQADAQTRTRKKKPPKPVPAKVMKDRDADVPAIGGTGVPLGYLGRTDKGDQMLSAAKYVRSGNGWDVTTGPAHILYNPRDTASGTYTVSATIEQLGKPVHAEGYGLFVGGSGLAGPNQSYFYFLVRGSGEIFAKTRTGEKLTGRIAWQKSEWVPEADSSGKASYKIAIQVTPDSVKFWVNNHQAAALPKRDLPTNGIYGVRINHNLRVHATPVTITRP